MPGLTEAYYRKLPVIAVTATRPIAWLGQNRDGNMDAACEKALQQIEDRDYAAKLKDDGMRNIIKYGIACYKNNCKVMLG